ncbi:MAG: GNAT family protein [Filomicrobium sp.]
MPLLGERVILRPLTLDDYTAWADLRAESREHLEPWEPAWRQDELWKSSFRLRVRHYQREARDDLGYAFGVFDRPGNFLGGVTLGNVRRGVMQCATLGYWLGQPYVGQGYMTESVRRVIQHAFGQLRLHRLEAASMPSNTASIRVLERTGFVKEGLARRYLKISGSWQDHIRFALLAEDLD